MIMIKVDSIPARVLLTFQERTEYLLRSTSHTTHTVTEDQISIYDNVFSYCSYTDLQHKLAHIHIYIHTYISIYIFTLCFCLR